MGPGGGPPRGGPGGPSVVTAPQQQGYAKPLPGIDEENKPFWDYAKKHELRMQKCLQCGKIYYPPSSLCPHCHSWQGSEWVKLSGKGQVYSFIVARRATNPAFAKEVPYVVAIIETEEGGRLISNVVGCKPEDVKIGMPVEVLFDDVTEEVTLPKFKPAS
ncbi:MAG: Zn-ribbon domain-containing OB-fold protein [Chloroflexi bacterium]|nr:Zn-ribbon domain-containing OB-fold protein [Chloroflexota bacterium]